MSEPKQQLQQQISIMLQQVGLFDATMIAKTLQGSIWRANIKSDIRSKSPTSKRVIKVTNKQHYQNSTAEIKNKMYHTQEDILTEQYLLQYLSLHSQFPKSIVKFYECFQTTDFICLVMEDGQLSLFDFIRKSHELIKKGCIDIIDWKRIVKILFLQMIEAIEFIHSLNISHSDISLENFLINDVAVEVTHVKYVENKIKMKMTFITNNNNNIQCKLCDFGLSQIFDSDKCLSNKYCGKKQYMSPEVLNKIKQYHPKLNDIWCVGICLFIMVFGCPPWKKPHINEVTFDYIINGCMIQILKAWNLLEYADDNLIDLLDKIFKYESERITLNKIKIHPWIVGNI